MKKTYAALILSATLQLVTNQSQAATVFVDNFDSYGPGDKLNWVAQGGWGTLFGTVDLIGVGGIYDFLPGNGSYIDLDGSTARAGILTHSLNLVAGTTYELTYSLAGSQRGDSNTVEVDFGSQSQTWTLASNDSFSIKKLLFTPGSTDTYFLGFHNSGGDNVGALLDNVSVVAVPEPETYAMILAGLGVMAYVVRRRRS